MRNIPPLRVAATVLAILALVLALVVYGDVICRAGLSPMINADKAPFYRVEDYDLIRMPYDGYAGVKRVYTFTIPQELGEAGYSFDLCFAVKHQYVSVFKDGELIYQVVEPSEPHLGHTLGRYWVTCPLSPADAGSEIRIESIPVYGGVAEPELLLAERFQVFRTCLRQELFTLSLTTITMGMGVLILLLGLLLPFEHRSRMAMVYLGLLALCTGIWKFTDLRFLTLYFTNIGRIFSYTELVTLLFMPILAFQFMNYQNKELPAYGGQLCAITAGLSAIIIMTLQLTEVLQLHDALTFIIALDVLLAVLYTILFFVLWKGKDYLWLLGYPLSAGADVAIYIIAGVSDECVIFLMWILLHSFSQGVIYVRQAIQREGELKEVRTQVLMNQIRPHFIHNTLASIYYLCDSDPAMAQDVVENFMNYLQANFAAVTKAAPVPFAEELEHTRAYLAVEQIRYQNQIFVTYDIEHTDFALPALTIQPLVENSVKYGVGKGFSPEHITIRTQAVPGGSRIQIQDDGSGFDPSKPLEGTHVGLNNIRERLAMISGGSMEIQSAPGCGTTVTLFVPEAKTRRSKKKQANQEAAAAST